jgi:hypothetical protein
MNNIFNEQEMRARRQFHRLFCTDLLRTCNPSQAIHEQAWSPEVLWDILRHMYEDTPLVPSDIETIVQIAGMTNEHNELWFKLQENCPIFEEFLVALSPYITPKAYTQMKLSLNGKSGGSTVTLFYRTLCCSLTAERVRIPQKDLYDIYEAWCRHHHLVVAPIRTFNKEMRLNGASFKKGYASGRCGVTFFHVAIDLSEEAWDDEPHRKAQGKSPQEIAEAFYGRRKKAAEKDDQEAARTVPAIQGSDNTSGCSSADFAEDGTTNVEDDADNLATDDFSDDGGTVPDSSEIGEAPDADSDVGRVHVDEGCGSIPPAEDFGEELTHLGQDGAKERVKSLPMGVRNFFKLMKMTYKVNPDNFEFRDFFNYAQMEGIQYSIPDKYVDLYILFLQYVGAPEGRISDAVLSRQTLSQEVF